jgi:hypothetical protein
MLSGQGRTTMNVIYNSENYCVFQYLGRNMRNMYELVDKRSARGAFFQDEVAARFMSSMRTAVAEEPSVEHIDEFLGGYGELATVPVVQH